MVPKETVFCWFLLVVLGVAAFSVTLRWSRGGMGLALFVFTLSALNILGHFYFPASLVCCIFSLFPSCLFTTLFFFFYH